MAIRVTPDDLRNVAGNLSRGAGEIDSQLGAMRSQVQALVEGNWEGAASQSFNTLYEKWGTSAIQLREALEGISSLLSNTGEIYQQTEQDLASRFNQG